MNPRATSVQMFQWRWNDLATECSQFLGPQGYGAIQISPPHASRVTTSWWGVYQPVNYKSLNSRFGTRAELQAMIHSCHAAGVRVYADVVVNQLATGASSSSGLATDGSSWNSSTLSYPYFSANDFHPACDIQDTDYNSASGRTAVQTCRLSSMPDLDTESPYVRGQIVSYMNDLLDLGIDGFRIDAAKHQSPQSLQAILSTVKQAHPRTQLGEPLWVTHEIIPDAEANRADYFSSGTVNEFHFAVLMREAWRNENGATPASIPTMMGTWNQWGGSWGFLPSEQATVFVNNWDTERDGSSLNTNNRSGAVKNDDDAFRYVLANIFMLAQGYGEVQLHSGFRFTQKDQDRPTASPYQNGAAQIGVNWDFVHRWSDIAPMVKFRAATIGQPQSNWVQGNANQIAFSRGSVGFVALNNSGSAWSRTFTTGLPAGTYCNILRGTRNADGTACSGESVVVDRDGKALITLPANTATMVPAVALYTGQALRQ